MPVTEAGEISLRRSANMRAVRRADTKPEMAVRRALHALGHRFRLQRQDLPGRPDIVLPRYGVAIFVHGCFSHRHEGCPKTTMPKTRKDFWSAKFEANITRDARALHALEERGWQTITVWECQTKHPQILSQRLISAIEGVRRRVKPPTHPPASLGSRNTSAPSGNSFPQVSR
ncbi:very short patch repair endonuclease [Mesorhizobium sp. RCC_202]|uniref:very short patch repair endonuclease n=1 Tax=Mesorhizobium sp. RCC_202 TaxID=3239222 RepID=UPI0035238E1B